MRLPSTRQLQYFVALVENEHFGKAAEACHVSQSAFSSAIKELENTLATQLVDRTNRQVTITSTGQQIATQARLVLGDITDLVELAAGEKQPLTGELRLGVIPTIAPFLLPKVLPKLRRKFPKLQLYLTEDQTDRIYEKLMDGELDLLLLALLACHTKTDRVEPENYRFSRLDADSILLLEDGHCLRDHALAACRIRDNDKVRRFAASSLLTLVEMVDADLGITFLPEMAERSVLLRNTHVKMYPLKESSYRSIGLAWRKGSNRIDEFHLLGNFLEENR